MELLVSIILAVFLTVPFVVGIWYVAIKFFLSPGIPIDADQEVEAAENYSALPYGNPLVPSASIFTPNDTVIPMQTVVISSGDDPEGTFAVEDRPLTEKIRKSPRDSI